jgi:DNA-directed RNA polymerase subunit RPC12/RpoP
MKYLYIITLIAAVIGASTEGGAGFIFYGLLTFILGFIIIIIFSFRCSKCGKWFSYKKVSENYSNSHGENILSDNVHATQNNIYECENCKNRIKSSRRITKKIAGYRDYQIDKILNKNKYKI